MLTCHNVTFSTRGLDLAEIRSAVKRTIVYSLSRGGKGETEASMQRLSIQDEAFEMVLRDAIVLVPKVDEDEFIPGSTRMH